MGLADGAVAGCSNRNVFVRPSLVEDLSEEANALGTLPMASN